MASVLGMLEERETAVGVRVEGLREEVTRWAEVLEAAEIELDRRVIAREELVEALAASAAETSAGSEAEEKAVLSLAPAQGSTVPPWWQGLPVMVVAPDYQCILGVLDQQRSTGHGPLRAKEIAVDLGLDATPRKSRDCGRMPGACGARGAPPGGVGGGECRPAHTGRPGRRLICVTVGHRLIASPVASRAS
ncbi:hypothetical protein [Streptomyces sp. NPDC127190]|uniref:hypothetical protein n=1 Tax=unclassified Streptomyces TaxID=2593676 RepID=UPI0036356DF0